MTDGSLSLTRGGPFHHLLRRVHLLGRARWFWLAAITWLPFMIGALVELAFTGKVDPVASDLSMHVRMLATIPLLIAAEDLLEARCAEVIEHVRDERMAERASLDAIVARTEHLRDSWVPEALLVVVVVVAGQLWLRDYVWTDRSTPTFARAWSFLFALPLTQFLILRWLWRWALWTYVLARLAWLNLSVDALHPDQAGGLKILAEPTEAFSLFSAGLSALAAAVWGMKLHAHHMTLKSLSPQFFTFVVVVMIVACAPLLMFTRKIYRARHRDADAYHRLARDFVDIFRTQWLAGNPPELNAPEIRTLNALGGSFRSADDTKIYPFDASTIIFLWAGTLAPFVPLALAEAPINEVATHFGKMLFGVAP
jgi:hypothetical protein